MTHYFKAKPYLLLTVSNRHPRIKVTRMLASSLVSCRPSLSRCSNGQQQVKPKDLRHTLVLLSAISKEQAKLEATYVSSFPSCLLGPAALFLASLLPGFACLLLDWLRGVCNILLCRQLHHIKERQLHLPEHEVSSHMNAYTPYFC